MRHSLVKFVLVLFLAKIDRLDSRPVEVIYTGDRCECAKNLPYEVNIPVLPEPAPLDSPSYGYTIDTPVQARAEYSYSFDFVVDEPVQPTPPPTTKANLFAVVDRVVLPKRDCVVETVAPCGLPAPPAPPPPPPKPAPPVVVKDYDYEMEIPVVTKSCACGSCSNPLKPSCRYVLNNKFQTNRIARQGGRSKRDITSKTQHHISELRSLFKSRKAARDARKLKKSKIVKRDIKGEYDLLEKEKADVDLTIPEIIQYMPETLLPQFKRGKCNIGCKNNIKRQKQKKENKSTSETANNDSNTKAQQQPTESPTESTHTMPIPMPMPMPSQQYISPQFAGVGYLKRSVNPYQYPCPCHPALMPPPYIPNPLHLATLAQNPGNPIWAQPRPLIDPIGHYVYDRLGHKYEVKNGSLKLVTPKFADEQNESVPATPITDGNVDDGAPIPITAQQTEIPQSIVGGQQLLQQAPIVGAPAHPYSSHDPQMDKVIRDIIYQHPDFVDATRHEPGSLTLPQNVQQDETMQFLGKLIRGRLNNWFDVNEDTPSPNLDELSRYTRETGTSIKFIPVVTVDKDKLNKYRQDQAQAIK